MIQPSESEVGHNVIPDSENHHPTLNESDLDEIRRLYPHVALMVDTPLSTASHPLPHGIDRLVGSLSPEQCEAILKFYNGEASGNNTQYNEIRTN